LPRHKVDSIPFDSTPEESILAHPYGVEIHQTGQNTSQSNRSAIESGQGNLEAKINRLLLLLT
jgi:hypothetical protein